MRSSRSKGNLPSQNQNAVRSAPQSRSWRLEALLKWSCLDPSHPPPFGKFSPHFHPPSSEAKQSWRFYRTQFQAHQTCSFAQWLFWTETSSWIQLWCHLFQIEQKKTYPRCRKSFDSLDFAWCEDVVKNWDLWLQVDDLLFVRHQPQEGMGPVIELALELTQQFLRPLSVPATQPLVLLMFNLPGGLGRWDWLLLDLDGPFTVQVKGAVISWNF